MIVPENKTSFIISFRVASLVAFCLGTRGKNVSIVDRKFCELIFHSYKWFFSALNCPSFRDGKILGISWRELFNLFPKCWSLSVFFGVRKTFCYFKIIIIFCRIAFSNAHYRYLYRLKILVIDIAIVQLTTKLTIFIFLYVSAYVWHHPKYMYFDYCTRD